MITLVQNVLWQTTDQELRETMMNLSEPDVFNVSLRKGPPHTAIQNGRASFDYLHSETGKWKKRKHY